MIKVEGMAMFPDEEHCQAACLSTAWPVKLNENTHQYLNRIEAGIRAEITEVGPETEAATLLWEKLVRVRRLSGVVVASFVGGATAAQQAAKYLSTPQREVPPEDTLPPHDPFESLARRMAS